jgi:hypothetical protein
MRWMYLVPGERCQSHSSLYAHQVAGNLASLKGCPHLSVLNLRWSKVVGNIEELEGVPLVDVDLMVRPPGTGCVRSG